MNEVHQRHSGLTRLVIGCQLAWALSGCAWQQAKTCCPVYYPPHYRFTEESVRVPPCGPDALFHGYKKTAWKTWPAGWEYFPPSRCPEDMILEAPAGAAEPYAEPIAPPAEPGMPATDAADAVPPTDPSAPPLSSQDLLSPQDLLPPQDLPGPATPPADNIPPAGIPSPGTGLPGIPGDNVPDTGTPRTGIPDTGIPDTGLPPAGNPILPGDDLLPPRGGGAAIESEEHRVARTTWSNHGPMRSNGHPLSTDTHMIRRLPPFPAEQ